MELSFHKILMIEQALTQHEQYQREVAEHANQDWLIQFADETKALRDEFRDEIKRTLNVAKGQKAIAEREHAA